MAIALLLTAIAVPVSVFAVRRPETPRAAVPLPTVSAPPTTTAATPAPTTTRRSLPAMPQASKATIALTRSSPATSRPGTTRPVPSATRVLLGPGTDADLPALLNGYCQATYGRFTFALSPPGGGGWACAGPGRAAAAIDMGAMCRWRYGDQAHAVQGNPTDLRTWRCYRDGS